MVLVVSAAFRFEVVDCTTDFSPLSSVVSIFWAGWDMMCAIEDVRLEVAEKRNFTSRDSAAIQNTALSQTDWLAKPTYLGCFFSVASISACVACSKKASLSPMLKSVTRSVFSRALAPRITSTVDLGTFKT